MPQLFWELEDPEAGKSSAYGTKSTAKASSRAALELPPELRADIELPMANTVSSNNSDVSLPKQYRQAVTGKAVALDARVYDVAADQVFSAVVDAMTSLNMPVESVDSPSGIVTTDWVRKGDHNISMLGGLMGKKSNITRHRFIVRVFRLKTEGQSKSRLEVRTLLQVFSNRHWVNSTMRQQESAAFFTTVEEQLGRIIGTTNKP